jgi:hypothetical protein
MQQNNRKELNMNINIEIDNAISNLIDAAYNTGYNSAVPGSAGKAWDTQDIRKREACEKFLVLMIERWAESIKDQLEEANTAIDERDDKIDKLEQDAKQLQDDLATANDVIKLYRA